MRDRERERQRQRQREKQAPRREPDTGLDPGSEGGAKPLGHWGCPHQYIFKSPWMLIINANSQDPPRPS